jgi:hypothetical protein
VRLRIVSDASFGNLQVGFKKSRWGRRKLGARLNNLKRFHSQLNSAKFKFMCVGNLLASWENEYASSVWKFSRS